MAKTKIYAPNKKYNGVTAGISFADGVGETSDERLKKWFKDRGYQVGAMKSKTSADKKPADKKPAEKTPENSKGKSKESDGKE